MVNNIMFRRLNDNFKEVDRALGSETGSGASREANRNGPGSVFDLDRASRVGTHGTGVRS